MVNFEQLEERALGAYERGRLRMASQVVLWLAPIIAVCLLEAQGRGPCVCCAAILLGVSLWLRWRDREGVESVTAGLLAGSVPLVIALAVSRFAPACSGPGALSYCTGASLLVAGCVGLVAAHRAADGRSRRRSLTAAAIIAALAASLGCVRLGVFSVLGVAAGIVLGSAIAARRVRQ